MNETSETLNLRIGNGSKIHKTGEILPTHPACGGVRTNGKRQARRMVASPVTCEKCLSL